jgi:hypothetical protein
MADVIQTARQIADAPDAADRVSRNDAAKAALAKFVIAAGAELQHDGHSLP